MNNATSRTRKLSIIAMLCALSYIVMVVGRIPIILFLKYDPKDIIITIGGFILGPLTSFVISTIVSLIEMITTSDTGIYGLIMNILSTCAFACVAAFIYKKKRTIKGAVVGLISGWLFMSAIMLFWNYLITPLYMGYPRAAVVELLWPAILPFNLLKGGLNAAITMLIYKPVVTALRRAHLIPDSTVHVEASDSRSHIWASVAAGLVTVVCVVLFLVLSGVI